MPKINDLPQIENLSTEANIPITQDGVTYKANVGMIEAMAKEIVRIDTLDLSTANEGVYICKDIINAEEIYGGSNNALCFVQDTGTTLDPHKRAYVIGSGLNPTMITVLNSI